MSGRYISLFSGIGGLDLAVEAFFGYEPLAFVEWDKACQEVLKARWPGVPVFGDVREFSHRGRGVDLVTGGFPCQDLSAAGKREGFRGKRSSLFYELARVVAEVEPRYVLLENVRGLLTAGGSVSTERGAAMAEVLGTLADLGFADIRWVMLAASDVGAAHRRQRIFVLATHPDRIGQGREAALRPPGQPGLRPQEAGSEPDGADRGGAAIADRVSAGLQGLAGDGVGGDQPGWLAPQSDRSAPQASGIAATDANERGRRRGRHQGRGDGGRFDEANRAGRGESATGRGGLSGQPASFNWGAYKAAPDAEHDGRDGGHSHAGTEIERQGGIREPAGADSRHPAGGFNWGAYEPAIRRWERVMGPAPHPVDDANRLSPDFVGWMMGFSAGWNGGQSRTQRLKQFGNAVVPHQAFAALGLLTTAETAPEGAVPETAA